MAAWGGFALRHPRLAHVAAALSASVLLAFGVAYYLTHEPAPQIRVLWRDGIEPARRAELERRFLLVNRAPFDDRFTYDLLDTRRQNIEALVNEPDVADTDNVGRSQYSLPPDYPYGESWMWIAHRVPVLRVPGVVPAIVLMSALVLALSTAAIVAGRRRRSQAV